MEETEKVLACPLRENDSGADNIRDYLKALLLNLWCEGEGFSGKRPFGNSGWENDLYLGLISAGLVEGKIDADGWLESIDDENIGKANGMIQEAIEAL